MANRGDTQIDYLANVRTNLPPHVRETIVTLAECVACGGDALASNQSQHSAVQNSAELLLEIPPGRRPAVFTTCVQFLPSPTLEAAFEIGPIRAAIAGDWEAIRGATVPVSQLRTLLVDTTDPGLWNLMAKFIRPSDVPTMTIALAAVIGELGGRCALLAAPSQCEHRSGGLVKN